jgi:hypothetical protein
MLKSPILKFLSHVLFSAIVDILAAVVESRQSAIAEHSYGPLSRCEKGMTTRKSSRSPTAAATALLTAPLASLRSSLIMAAPLTLLLSGPAGGQTYYLADLHDHQTHHLHHGATGAAFLSLNRERDHLSYQIAIEGLNLKPNAVDRTEPNDIIGIHMHLNVPGTVGPHVLNIFGLATYGMPAEEDADLVVNYTHQILSGVYDYSDATIDPNTGAPYFQFFPLTTKIIDDWLDDLDAGDLMFAVHTVASGFPTMAIHGRIYAVPEPATIVVLAAFIGWPWLGARRRWARKHS